MDVLNQIEKLEEQMNSFAYNELVAILGLTFVVFLIIVVVFSVSKYSENIKLKHTVYTIFGTSLLILLVAIIFFGQEVRGMTEELETLEKELLYSLDKTVTVETKDIVNSIPVHKYYCPHVKLKDSEKCTYVEFVSNTGITQVFIPLERTAYANYEDSLSITYLDLTEKERNYINKMQQTKHIVINKSHRIQEDGWSLGISINK